MNNNINNSINNNNYNNNDIDKLFSLVWKNKYLNKLIFYHLKLFNLFNRYKYFEQLELIESFSHRDYLSKIKVFVDTEDVNLESLFNNSSCSSVKSLKIYFSNQIYKKGIVLPNNIESLKLNAQLSNYSQFNGLKKLVIDFKFIKALKFKLPDNLVHLGLKEYNVAISIGWLPVGLKVLHILGIQNFPVIEKGALHEGLKELVLHNTEIIKFENGYLPDSLEILICESEFNSYYNFDNSFKFPSSLRKLNIYCERLIELPKSITELGIRIRDSLSSNNQKIIKSLPNLKSLSISLYNLEIESNGKCNLPNSLTTFKTFSLISNGFQLLPNSLPPYLKILDIGNNFDNGNRDLLDLNIFPSSLEYLSLGKDFNNLIGPNVLPEGLKTLVLGSLFNQKIHQGTIPKSLETMRINNQNFNQPIEKLTNPFTLVTGFSDCYYEQFRDDKSRVGKLCSFSVPNNGKSLEKMSFLINAVNLELLDLNLFSSLDFDINLSSYLSTNNSLKTIILCDFINLIIDLKYFHKLETIILIGNPYVLIVPNSTSDQNFDFYSLKSIQVSKNSKLFLDNVDPIFYELIVIKNNK